MAQALIADEVGVEPWCLVGSIVHKDTQEGSSRQSRNRHIDGGSNKHGFQPDDGLTNLTKTHLSTPRERRLPRHTNVSVCHVEGGKHISVYTTSRQHRGRLP